MSWLKSAAALLSLSFLVACEPGYFRKESEWLVEQARLSDSIQIERSNQRLLVRQAQICLLSADGGNEAGAQLLRTIQSGFRGYFLSVSVSAESIDYLRAVSTDPCPGATFLFYVEPVEYSACVDDKDCHNVASQYLFTVISVGERSLVDRLKLSIKNSFLPGARDEQERQQKAFERLAIALTGAT